jgi:predicted CoA-binding protein
MITRKKIDDFLRNKRLAIAGVSRNPKKFGHTVYRDLKENGYEVLAVNPVAESINGDPAFKTVSELPQDVRHLLILTPKQETDAVLREAINKGITNIWVQQMSETADTIRIAEEFNVELITGKCIYMFAEPVTGFHKFHRTLMKIFGRLPK